MLERNASTLSHGDRFGALQTATVAACFWANPCFPQQLWFHLETYLRNLQGGDGVDEEGAFVWMKRAVAPSVACSESAEGEERGN
ncbi:hypothetical protein HPY42_00725 [Coprothermobacteraceae bacterium]|nr:hypothetical protein [Coprothermobacteraceae bacterium]